MAIRVGNLSRLQLCLSGGYGDEGHHKQQQQQRICRGRRGAVRCEAGGGENVAVEDFDSKLFRKNLMRSENYNRSGFGYKKETLEQLEQEYNTRTNPFDPQQDMLSICGANFKIVDTLNTNGILDQLMGGHPQIEQGIPQRGHPFNGSISNLPI